MTQHYDPAGDPGKAAVAAASAALYGVDGRHTALIFLSPVLNPPPPTHPPIVCVVLWCPGIVGALHSSSSKPMGTVSTHFKMPQISGGSTNGQLSDKGT